MSGGWIKNIVAVWLGLTFQTSTATADPFSDATEGAINLCAEIPSEIDDARLQLSNLGWKAFDKATSYALLTRNIHYSLDDRDPTQMIENAVFTAASMLGNSSLGPEQIGASFEELYISITGILENSPACVISGPEALRDIALLHPLLADAKTQRSAASTQVKASGNDGDVALSYFVPDQYEKLIADLGASNAAQLVKFLRPVTFTMIPAETSQ